MEMIYRGYPQAFMDMLVAQNVAPEMVENLERLQTMPGEWNMQGAGIEPYMIYNREMQTEVPNVWDERRRMRAEYEYFRGLYPMSVRKWQRLVDEELDRNDGPGSAIYDEYPDREMLYRLRDRIIRNAAALGYLENQDLVLLLLLNEVLRRRAERR